MRRKSHEAPDDEIGSTQGNGVRMPLAFLLGHGRANRSVQRIADLEAELAVIKLALNSMSVACERS